MTRTVRELLDQRSQRSIVGRTQELAVLLETLEADGPLVVWVHGIAGIGKSTLLEAFAAEARAGGAVVVQLDGRLIEPTERGFLHVFGDAMGGGISSAEQAVDRLGRLGERAAVAIDNYEVLRLLDTWLRQVFVPSMPDNVRLILCGREPPVSAWRAQGWDDVFRSVRRGPLGDAEAEELLRRAGVQGDVQRINRFARGHPLALRVAASAIAERSDLDLDDVAFPSVIEELTGIYVAHLDALTRRALDAASVVRRATLSLLAAMLPDVVPLDAFERLRALPFVETVHDGLMLHETMQQAIAARLHAADPATYRVYRRAAWRQLRKEVRDAGTPELWRYTADILYTIENPVLREAFFPSGAHLYAVEPSRVDDGPSILEIAHKHEPPSAAAEHEAWWERSPESFRTVRDQRGAVAGFYYMFDPRTVGQHWLDEDRITKAWWDHLRRDAVPRNQRVLFLPRWLCGEHGEMPCPVQAACWLDIKSVYMEMRPSLRRLYTTLREVATYEPVITRLGFVPLPDLEVQLDEVAYRSAMLDFGPSSVDGWLARLAGSELGVDEDEILDINERELVLDEERIPLTHLEFEVINYLNQREGRVVKRSSLLEDVWGYDYEGGSNVVDAVVRSLRRKLGDRASMIQTVRGLGYRLRLD